VTNPARPVDLGLSTDARRLGVLLRSLMLKEVDDRSVRLGERVVFAEGSGAERLLGDGWSSLEPTGVWTIGERAQLILDLTDIAPTDLELVLDVAAFVTPDHPELEVEALAREQRLAARVLRYGEADHSFRIQLPAAMMDEERRAVLDLYLRDPARPVDLGLSGGPRRLGVHLRSLTVGRPETGANLIIGYLRAKIGFRRHLNRLRMGER
jgi:hypothetical protein